MSRIRISRIMVFAVLMITIISCNAGILTTVPSDYEGSSGRPFTKAYFTGAAPDDITATQAFYTDRISLIFNVVPGADYYEIYKAAVPRSLGEVSETALDWKKLDHDVMPFRETDRIIIWNDVIPDEERKVYRYYYKVRAGSNIDYSNDVKEGCFSDVVEGWTLVSPSSLSVTQGEFPEKITVSWQGDDHVQGYLVYMLDAASSTWEVAKDGFFAAPPQGVKDFTFDYYPEETNYGKTLYFALGSVSLGDIRSDRSVARSGYTYVKGAPDKPSNVKVSQADYTDQITISWTKPDLDNIKPGWTWKISRYTDNTPETEILSFNAYDLADPKKVPPENLMFDKKTKTYTYTDTIDNGLKPGEVYHYKIMATSIIDKDGESIVAQGKALVKDGALFAPPRDISISVAFPTETPDGIFTFSVPTPFGYREDSEEHTKGWKYTLYGRFNDGINEPSPYTLLMDDIDVLDEKTEFSYKYDPSAEGKRNEFVITIKDNNGNVSKNTEQLYKIVLSADKVLVEDIVIMSNSWNENLKANGNGVYPVYLKINNENAFKKLFISVNNEEAYEVTMDELKAADFTIKSPENPFETYEYTVYGESLFGRKTKVSKPIVAYGAITPEKFIKLFEAYAMKPWEFVGKAGFPANLNAKWTSGTPGKLHSMIDSHGMDALGKVSVDSEYHGGKLNYSSIKGDGFAGNVYFSFKDFGELEDIWSNGSYEMINVSTSGNGDIVNGTVKVDGMYPADVDFSNLSVRGYGFAGNYRVSFKNELGEQIVKATQN